MYYGAHGHADGMWMAAEDLHYHDGARERVMVYPGARRLFTDATPAVVLLYKCVVHSMSSDPIASCWLRGGFMTSWPAARPP